jgi:hypothetical protein
MKLIIKEILDELINILFVILVFLLIVKIADGINRLYEQHLKNQQQIHKLDSLQKAWR